MSARVRDVIDGVIVILQGWVGRGVLLESSLSRSPTAGHDRHFATHSRFSMQLEFVGARLSGAALMFEGSQGVELACYEVALEVVQEIEFENPDRLVVIERFGPALERRTAISARTDPETEHAPLL